MTTDASNTEYVLSVRYNEDGSIYGFSAMHLPFGAHEDVPGKLRVLEKPDPMLEYVVNGEVVPRPTNPTTKKGYVLSNIPEGSVIQIDGTSYPVVDTDTVTLDFPNPGTYKVEVVKWPYTNKTYEIVK